MTSQQTKKIITVVGDDKLLDYKEKLIKELPESAEYQVLKEDLITVIDNFKGLALQEGLKRRFGVDFHPIMEHFVNPFAAKNEIRYVLNKLEWTAGPNTHQVHFYIKENFGYYLKDQEFNESLFERTIPNIEKRYTTWFKPLDINDTKFNWIPIEVREIDTRVDDNIVDTLCIIKLKDEKLGIKEVRGRTRGEALARFQEKLEGLFYREILEGDYYEAKSKDEDKKVLKSYRQRLMTYAREEVETEEKTTAP